MARLGALPEATAFAYGSEQRRAMLRRTRAASWRREELFARFLPFAFAGAWDGRDAVAG